MITITMLDDNGDVVETSEGKREKDGTCDDCANTNVVTWTIASGVTYMLCDDCLKEDGYTKMTDNNEETMMSTTTTNCAYCGTAIKQVWDGDFWEDSNGFQSCPSERTGTHNPINRNMNPAEVLEFVRNNETPLGATLCYPQDCYPYTVEFAGGKTGKTLYVNRVRTVDATTGHEPHHYEGPYPVWTHEYTDEELEQYVLDNEETSTARWSEARQCYLLNGTPLRVGVALYHRNYSF